MTSGCIFFVFFELFFLNFWKPFSPRLFSVLRMLKTFLFPALFFSLPRSPVPCLSA